MGDGFRDDHYVPDVVPDEDVAYFRDEPRYGHSVGWGERPAVLVVDMTLAFTDERQTVGDRCIAATDRLLNGARGVDVPVIYTRPHAAGTFPSEYPAPTKGRPGTASDNHREWLAKLDEIAPTLEPTDNDLVVDKPRASAFFDTHLANYLHYEGVDTIIVAGMTTSVCVRSTVIDGHSSNFRPIVPPECVGDPSTIAHEVALFDLSMKHADVTPLDDVMTRLEQYGESAAGRDRPGHDEDNQ